MQQELKSLQFDRDKTTLSVELLQDRIRLLQMQYIQQKKQFDAKE